MEKINTLRNYTHINVGASHVEMIPKWLAITIWEGDYDGLEKVKIENDINIFKHKEVGGNVINHNVVNGLPFGDSSVQCIFSSHFIEHLTFEEAVNFLKECHRVLRPGGILRIICPDIMIWIDKIYKGTDESFFKTYKDSLDVPYWENYIYPIKDKIKTNTQVLNSMIYNWGHKWMWDFESLKTELESIGFDSIQQMEHLKTNYNRIKEIETRLSYNTIEARNLESLFVECKVKQVNKLL